MTRFGAPLACGAIAVMIALGFPSLTAMASAGTEPPITESVASDAPTSDDQTIETVTTTEPLAPSEITAANPPADPSATEPPTTEPTTTPISNGPELESGSTEPPPDVRAAAVTTESSETTGTLNPQTATIEPPSDTPTAAAIAPNFVVEGPCAYESDGFVVSVGADVDAQFAIEGSPSGTYAVKAGERVSVRPVDTSKDGSIRVVPSMNGSPQGEIFVPLCFLPPPLTVGSYCDGSTLMVDLTPGYDMTVTAGPAGDILLTAGQPTTIRAADARHEGYSYVWIEYPNNEIGYRDSVAVRVEVCPPSSPTGLTATVAPEAGVTSGQVRLTWLFPENTGGYPITDYRIERSTNGTTWTTVNDPISTTTMATVSGLTNGTTYQFRVSAYNGDYYQQGQWSAISNVASVIPRGTPPEVSGLTVTVAPTLGVREGQARLAWNDPSSDGGELITDYVIQHSVDGVNWTTVSDSVSTARSLTVSGLRGGTTYRFRISAKNSFGVGTPSSVVTKTMPTRPGAPTGLVTTRSPGTIRLTWAAPANGGIAITDYMIQRSRDGRTWTTMPDTVSTSRAYTNSRLSPGIRLWYRVIAKNALGNGSPSAAVSVVTPTRPSAPRSLYAYAGSKWASLDWYLPTSNGGTAITDYIIQRSTDGRTWATMSDGVSTSRWWTQNWLTNGRRYYYRVAARNAMGIGPYSNVIRVTPQAAPGAVSGLRATAGYNSLTLTWNPPSTGGPPSYYRVSEWIGYRWNSFTTTSPSIRLINGSGCHDYRVAAVNGTGTGPYRYLYSCYRW